MDPNIYKLIFIGTVTGITASFVGGGAEMLIAPLLIFMKVFDDYKTAVGTSLASLLLPIGIVAVYFYANTKCKNKSCVHWSYALILSLFFVLGTTASYFAVQMDNKRFKQLFAILMICLGIFILFNE